MNKATKTMTAAELAQLPPHQLKLKLWQAPSSPNLPQLAGDRLDDEALEMSVAQTGVQIPVIICNGAVVDGMRRIKAAAKFNPEMSIPVYECEEGKAGLTVLQSITQVKSLTKFQRLFIIYPIIREAAEKLIFLGNFSRNSHIASRGCSDCNDEKKQPERVDDAVCVAGVTFVRISDLAQFLNVSRRWFDYCRGVYEAMEQKIKQNGNAELVKFVTHKFVFEEGTPIERIASAIGGFDSARNPEKEALSQDFKQAFAKVNNAFNTVIERVNKDVYLSTENRPVVEQQVENFASKLPDEIAEILSKTLAKRLKA